MGHRIHDPFDLFSNCFQKFLILGAPPVETIDIIVECTLDESAMAIPDMLLSRYPHYFDLTAGNKP